MCDAHESPLRGLQRWLVRAASQCGRELELQLALRERTDLGCSARSLPGAKETSSGSPRGRDMYNGAVDAQAHE